jgi:hypothetical protein
MRQPKRTRIVLGLLCIALGTFPLAIAFGFIPVDETQVQTPMWVVALSGVVFLIGGCMIFLANHSGVNDLLAAILCLLFGIVGAWVSLFAPADGFSGGVPLLSPEANVTLARWVFGCGALICFAISVYAFRRSIQSSRYFA